MYISQIYNYLNHDLVPKRRTRTHKASELKEVYNSISKYNQSSPLYLVDLSESRQTQMIDIKEQAQSVSYDTLKELFGSDSSLRSDILKSVNRLSLDPLAYVDRLIVTYPNSDKKQTATYTQSVYSGLMYNNYA